MVVVWSREGYRPGLGIYIIGQSSQSASNTFAIGGRPLVMTSRRDNHHTPYTSAADHRHRQNDAARCVHRRRRRPFAARCRVDGHRADYRSVSLGQIGARPD